MGIQLLIFLPLLFTITLPFNSIRVRNVVTYIYVFVLMFISLNVFFSSSTITLNFPHVYHQIFIFIDSAVLLYFLHQALKYKNKLVLLFALAQIILFGIVLLMEPSANSYDILIDSVSLVMLLVVNIIGGIIIIYALKYIASEDFKECKKNLFIAILFFFLGVMNLLVSTNNLEIFFLAFELTTLCSYILIRYRLDDLAVQNALRALWMNQIGGVAILLALIASIMYYETIYLDVLLKVVDDMFLLPISLLIIAAFVKGASIPFDRWLLGAMVAPTPVSAILHSATMVKIAPYLILKIAPAFSPMLAMLVLYFGSFVFMSASILALSKDFFKEILGYSTIALLGFMMAIAALGTEEAIQIVLILIVFHAISKALLFFQAGILEKVYHLKYLHDIDYLASRSKLVVFFVLVGFASLTLPPFGAFIGKFSSIELLSSLIEKNIFYIFPLVFILLGSVFLTLLYFKVVTKLLPKTNEEFEEVEIPFTYKFTSFALVALLIGGVYVSYLYSFLGTTEIVISSVLIVVTMLMLFVVNFKNVKIVKEYNCAEKDDKELGAFYFEIPALYKSIITYSVIVLMCMILIVGVL